MRPVDAIPLDEIRSARKRIVGFAIRTPLVRLNVDNSPAEIYLKLENLQPIGSFKVRGAANAMRLCTVDELANGVYTASAGNMAQGVAFVARRLGVRCSAIVPDHAPETKLSAIQRLGAEVVRVPFDDWWSVIVTHRFEGLCGRFIHPVTDPAVIAGNGTIGLEILEDLPDVDAIVIPYGGGGLSCGIASAVRALKPDTKVYAAEIETAAPLAASLAAGEPREIQYTPSFVDGIGGKSVLAQMWPLVQDLVDGSLVVSLLQTAGAIRLLAARNHIIAEGAGATSVAAALAGLAGGKKIVSVVSGGNIDAATLCTILNEKMPKCVES
ncbi:MAG: threonine/serine dehydratase [Chloroflexi bacterium]|nr:threonine/serine dehydratase [Chloroflexota bacterium]